MKSKSLKPSQRKLLQICLYDSIPCFSYQFQAVVSIHDHIIKRKELSHVLEIDVIFQKKMSIK